MKILVYKGKHQTEYYDHSDPAKSFLKLFKNIDGMEYYYFNDGEDEEIKEIEQELKDLANATSKASVERRFQLEKRLKSKKEDFEENKEQNDLYKKAKKGDAKAAERLLRLRRDHEYEGWEIEELQ